MHVVDDYVDVGEVAARLVVLVLVDEWRVGHCHYLPHWVARSIAALIIGLLSDTWMTLGSVISAGFVLVVFAGFNGHSISVLSSVAFVNCISMRRGEA